MATIPPDTPENRRRLLQRMDVLKESKKFGFVCFGEPSPAGWQYGRFPEPVGCGALNIGGGVERGNWRSCDNKGPGCLACYSCQS